MLTRHEQWEGKLHTCIEAHKATPFAWGKNDCALAVCDHVLAQTGVDLAANFRGKYSSQAGGMAAIAAAYPGVNTLSQLVEAITKQHGIPEINPKFAQRGDIALLTIGGQESLAIVHLSGRHVAATGETGLHLLKLSSIQRAWRVGALSPSAALGSGDQRVRVVRQPWPKPMPPKAAPAKSATPAKTS